MEKKELLLKVLVLLVVVSIAFVAVFIKNNTTHDKTDGLKFKEDYESLNHVVRESDGATYNLVDIPSDNPMKYVSAIEAVEIIKKRSGILYIGANWCPWCRNAVEVLIDVAKEKNVNTIYYLDLTEYRNVWEIKNGSLEKTTTEKEGYYDLLSALDQVLGENSYTLKDKDGKVYDTKEKRIYMPFVLAIKDGEIVDTHVGTVDLNKEQTKYDKLTEEQEKELHQKYQSMFQKIESNVCTSGDYCN